MSTSSPLLNLLGDPRLAPVGRDRVSLHHRNPEPVTGQDALHPLGDVSRAGVRRVHQHPAPLQPLRRNEVEECLLLRIDPFLGERGHPHDGHARLGVEDGLAPRAAVRVGEQRLQVRAEQPLGAGRQRLAQTPSSSAP